MTDYYRKVIREQVDTVATPARWRVELDCGHSAPWFDGDHVPVQCRVGENVWCDECLFVASSAKRVWKENWQDDEGQVNPFGTREIKQPMVVCMYGALEERAARSRLIAAAPAMVRLFFGLSGTRGMIAETTARRAGARALAGMSLGRGAHQGWLPRSGESRCGEEGDGDLKKEAVDLLMSIRPDAVRWEVVLCRETLPAIVYGVRMGWLRCEGCFESRGRLHVRFELTRVWMILRLGQEDAVRALRTLSDRLNSWLVATDCSGFAESQNS